LSHRFFLNPSRFHLSRDHGISLRIDWAILDPIKRLSEWPEGTKDEDKQRHIFEDRPDFIELERKSKKAQQDMVEEEEARQKEIADRVNESMKDFDVSKRSIYSIGSELPDPTSSGLASVAWLRLLGTAVARDMEPDDDSPSLPVRRGFVPSDLPDRAARSMGDSLGAAALRFPASAIDARPDVDEPVFFFAAAVE
jgi:hypothetical protein